MKTWKQIREELNKIEGTQYGSNEGGVHVDDKGNKFYVKYNKNPEQARAEVLASKIYHHLGVKTVSPEHKVIDGRHAVISKWNDDLKTMHPHDFEKTSEEDHHQLGKMYHAAILTKNWDAVGLGHDNIMRNKKTGDLHTVDTGGSFHFRAQGGPKDYGPDIEEQKSLRNRSIPAGHVFNHAFSKTPQAEHESLSAVHGMNMDKVHKDFKESGLKNWEDLHKSFVSRREKLLSHYGYGDTEGE